MSKSQSSLKLEDRILGILEEGEKSVEEMREAIPDQASSISNCLTRLKRESKIVKVDRGIYRLPGPQDVPAEPKNPRGEAENTETINKMLNLYDKLLDTFSVSIEEEDWDGIVEKIEAIKSLRWLGATVDQLMKRWYLVHRGYDTNTRQAVEDAKQKTVDREKWDVENAPPEDQIKVVMAYDESMRDLLAKMPKPVQEETKV